MRKQGFRSHKSLVLVTLLIFALAIMGASFAFAQDTPAESGITQVYGQVSPSVVSINVVARQPGSGFSNEDNTVIGSGSGFVFDKDGHIVTNNHVVDGATEIVVNFYDGTLARAEVVGLDPDSDLAVLKVDLPADKLQPVEFGDSDALEIGQPVLAIGSPFGQRWTLTTGIVSALDRTIQGLTDFSIGGVIQTDASINPGNSGGPLLDMQGHVIGVNSQILSSSRSSSGVGFSIPGNLTRRVAQALIDKGFVDYSYLGISGMDVSIEAIEAFKLPNDEQGIMVLDVVAGGPAARAGLEKPITSASASFPSSMDIVTAINGQPLRGMSSLVSYLAKNTSPGDTATLTVLRNGTDTMDVSVTLMPRPH